jgi:hypothetical protein
VDALAQEAEEGRKGAISLDEVPQTVISREFPNGEIHFQSFGIEDTYC